MCAGAMSDPDAFMFIEKWCVSILCVFALTDIAITLLFYG